MTSGAPLGATRGNFTVKTRRLSIHSATSTSSSVYSKVMRSTVLGTPRTLLPASAVNSWLTGIR